MGLIDDELKKFEEAFINLCRHKECMEKKWKWGPIHLILGMFLLIPGTVEMLALNASVSWIGCGMFALGAVLLWRGIILYREERHCEEEIRLWWFAGDILRAQKSGGLKIKKDLSSLSIGRWRIGVTWWGSLYLTY